MYLINNKIDILSDELLCKMEKGEYDNKNDKRYYFDNSYKLGKFREKYIKIVDRINTIQKVLKEYLHSSSKSDLNKDIKSYLDKNIKPGPNKFGADFKIWLVEVNKAFKLYLEEASKSDLKKADEYFKLYQDKADDVFKLYLKEVSEAFKAYLEEVSESDLNKADEYFKLYQDKADKAFELYLNTNFKLDLNKDFKSCFNEEIYNSSKEEQPCYDLTRSFITDDVNYGVNPQWLFNYVNENFNKEKEDKFKQCISFMMYKNSSPNYSKKKKETVEGIEKANKEAEGSGVDSIESLCKSYQDDIFYIWEEKFAIYLLYKYLLYSYRCYAF